MAFRFRRSIKVLPGLRINTSLKSISASFGGKGFRYTVGTSGKRVTASIPGTGLSYSVQSGRKKKAKPPDEQGGTAAPALVMPLVPAFQSRANWYVHINGEARGPLTSDALREALAQGALSEQDWIWREGLADWIQVGDEWTSIVPSSATDGRPVPAVRDDRWNVGKAFLIMLALSAVLAAINHKGVASEWARLSFPDFLASICRRLLVLPIIVATFAAARNFFVCR